MRRPGLKHEMVTRDESRRAITLGARGRIYAPFRFPTSTSLHKPNRYSTIATFHAFECYIANEVTIVICYLCSVVGQIYYVSRSTLTHRHLHRRTHPLSLPSRSLLHEKDPKVTYSPSGVPKPGPSIIYHTQNSHNQLDRPAA